MVCLRISMQNFAIHVREHLFRLTKHRRRHMNRGHRVYISRPFGEPSGAELCYVPLCIKERDLLMKDDEIEFKEHLKKISGQGVNLYLEGKPSSPDEIASRFFVCEDAVYMPDYIVDENGRLTQVRYDKVKCP